MIPKDVCVHFGRGSKPSALALRERLSQKGYDGPDINFGYGVASDGLNAPQAIRDASNKRLALRLMCETGVPIPKQWDPGEYPGHYIVGRRDHHKQGRGFWLCKDVYDVHRAIGRGATHFMDYIADAREFRVHIVDGRSIKISEKIGGGMIKNHRMGSKCVYPHGFDHKQTLRKHAKAAVEALGLDFGAVDILYKDGDWYVLEVNSAPCLTDAWSDTLERYSEAFMRRSE